MVQRFDFTGNATSEPHKAGRGFDLERAKLERPKLPHVSDEMRHLYMLLSEEILRWPGVNVRPMFGMRAFYRANIVFAMLPEERALGSPQAIAYKVATSAKKKDGKKWRLLELTSVQELGAALAVLDEAYRKAGRLHRKK